MGYLTYYLGFILLSYALRSPWLMAGLLLVIVFRRFLPDPVVWVRTQGRIRALETQIAANPANITARRDRAQIALDRLRPRKALKLLDEARRRAPDDPELLYLTGVARLRSGDAEGALEPLVRAVDLDPRVRYGEPYLVAAEALTRLRRFEEAEDALERYVRANGSSVQGWVRLARVRRGASSAIAARGDAAGAKEALAEALRTFAQVPRYRKRSEIGWWLRAQLDRMLS